MGARFDGRADWPGFVSPGATGLEAESCATTASALAAQWFPVAARTCGVRDWTLRAAPEHGPRLAAALAACAIAADHFAARVPCPRRPSNPYLLRRFQAAREAVPAALARRAVMECVPARWVPEQAVCAQIQGRLMRAGFGAEVTGARIAPPPPDGAGYVAQACGRETQDVWQRARRQPIAAVLHRMGQVEACVVSWSDGGGFRAFVPGAEACGRALEPADIVAAVPLECADPPAGRFFRLARALGIGGLVWAANRVFRIWTGGRRNAALR